VAPHGGGPARSQGTRDTGRGASGPPPSRRGPARSAAGRPAGPARSPSPEGPPARSARGPAGWPGQAARPTWGGRGARWALSPADPTRAAGPVPACHPTGPCVRAPFAVYPLGIRVRRGPAGSRGAPAALRWRAWPACAGPAGGARAERSAGCAATGGLAPRQAPCGEHAVASASSFPSLPPARASRSSGALAPPQAPSGATTSAIECRHKRH
jgi:hypothetical protein